MTTLNWGIIGTGSIAHTFASQLPQSNTGKLVAVASRTQEKADAFAQEFGADVKSYGSYEAMLQDANVQAVYVSTPHPSHAEWGIACAEAGKAILCEKPLTLDYPTALALVEAAHENGVFLMEAFMYRCHPQTQKLRELIRSGAIGDVRLMQISFAFDAGYNLQSRLLNPELGGGGILDVGCYAASLARLVAGEANGKAFADPVKVQATGNLGKESRVDEWAVAQLQFDGKSGPIFAQLSTGVRCNTDSQARIYGSDGWIEISSPWFCGPNDGVNLRVHRNGKTEEIRTPSERSLYALEADVVAENLEAKSAPEMSPGDTLGNMKTLDAWRQGVGVEYRADTLDAPTASNRSLRVRTATPSGSRPKDLNPPMQYGQIAHLDKPISRFVIGCMFEGAGNPVSAGFAALDDFYERGGNAFDTAQVYGTDRILGAWVRSRGVREQVVILGKGAHPPNCSIEGMKRQLDGTLRDMKLDALDIYMPHRDNTDIPIGEWIDAFNEAIKAGKFKAFGGSNWTLERIEAGNEYAHEHGLQGFSALSNNFSLARMVDPVWAGCRLVSDKASRDWLTQHQIANFAWSSQARGFFVRGSESFTDDAELARCWYAPDNFQRLERAKELAAQKNTTPINIAAAYVLAQPFPQFALIGPRTHEETRTALSALNVSLSPEERAYLNLEQDAV